jgi:beta-mannosidase
VHLDLQQAGEIPNPLEKENYPALKWVSESDYVYSTEFTVSEAVFGHVYHKLTFEGIDTYAEVFLNDRMVLRASNAFREYSVHVSGILRQGSNKLEVRINSTKGFDQKGQQKDRMPFIYAHTRKACYQYSWDWAPYLVTAGLWKSVFLESYNEVKLNYVWVRTRAITKLKATLNFAIALEIPNAEGVSGYHLRVIQGNETVATVEANEQYTYLDLNVPNPKLWWPNGIGEPYIYDFRVLLLRQGQLVDQRSIPFGIRTVELDLTDKKFQVKVNGYPVYCKGANWVPPDMFYPRLENKVYTPANTIEALLEDAMASNYNMIRVWGGGQYESDRFLELASRKGLMLFYDFMFSDSIYPSSEEFLLNVEEEVKQQIRRARNYPAITLWCGNNEILQGVKDWGWGSPEYNQDYHRLFEVLIPKIVEYESPYVPYIPSSPIYGVGNYGLERGGDVHFWGVWAGGAGFETYQSTVGKFNSEFGTQALPVWETIQQGITKDPSYNSEALLLHERHGSAFSTLQNYMSMYAKKALNFELETYQSGLVQAFAIELAIKAQRSAKPDSAGTLVWQLNDAWPAISWSSIDYYGRWKPLQFMEKRLFPDVAIFFLHSRVHVVNDKLYEVNALALIKIFDLNGTLLFEKEQEVSLKENEAKIVYEIQDGDYKQSSKESCVVYTEIVAGKGATMSSTHFQAKFKELKLLPAEIEVEYHPDFNLITIETKASVVKNLFISRKSKYLKLSDNYFDLVPGHPVKVTVLGPDSLAAIKDDLVFRSYREVYEAGSSVTVRVK